MRCTSPKKVSFDYQGNITFSSRKADKQFAPFTIPCSKCIACQLSYSQEWAIRCLHETYVTPKLNTNLFITLTYSDETLPGPILVRNDFDRFLERLKDNYGYRSVYACGEYGKLTQRPHWHALLFDFTLPDLKHYSNNKHGNALYTSKELDRLWPYNSEQFPNKIGYVDYKSAAYVARYHNKGLVHGTKQEQRENNLLPISIKTRGLGKAYLEKYHDDIFRTGFVIEDGKRHPIPRYYERWYEKHHPEKYIHYVTQIKTPIMEETSRMSDKQYQNYLNMVDKEGYQITREQVVATKLMNKTRDIMRNKGD